jgi:hypothetical protein
MHDIAWFLVLLAFAGGCTGRSNPSAAGASTAAAAGGPIFREISVEPRGTIRLGTPFAQRATVARSVAPGTFVLVGDALMSYGGTDSLLVEVDPENRVRAMHFVYPARFDLAAAVAEYTAMLGAPRERVTVDSAGGRLERASWSDGRTEFILLRLARDGETRRVWSLLRDHVRGR